MARCGCGVPNKANWYIRATIGRDVPGGTETGYVDIYVCDDHDNDDSAKLLEIDRKVEWDILDEQRTRLR